MLMIDGDQWGSPSPGMTLRCACGWCGVPCYVIPYVIRWTGGAGCLPLFWGLFGEIGRAHV